MNRLRLGLFVAVGEYDHRLLAMAAARSCRGSAISHRSAALLRGLPVLTTPPRPNSPSPRAGPATWSARYCIVQGLIDGDALDSVLANCWNWPGIRRATRAVDLVDGRAESPLESISRLVLRWARLPGPDLQTSIDDEFGIFVGRADFYWPDYRVVGEADGKIKSGEEVIGSSGRGWPTDTASGRPKREKWQADPPVSLPPFPRSYIA